MATAGRKKGTQKTGGRKKGVPNKRTIDIRARAQKAGPNALAYLIEVLEDDSEDTKYRLSASNSILDRAYGKPAQAIVGEDGEGPVSIINKILLVAPDASSDG